MLSLPPRYRPTSLSIQLFAPESIGPGMRTMSVSSPASATNVQNLAWLYPFRLYEWVTFVRGWWYTGATANGNVDIGIYSDAFVRLGSTGAVGQGSTSVLNSSAFSVAAGITCGPGRYYYGMSCSSATGTFFSHTVIAAQARALGVVQMAAAHVLPDPITPAAFAQTIMPHFGIMRRTTV